jgi:hypothetical protein
MQEQYENQPWLHVYPQHSYHGPLRIVGTRAAFIALAAAQSKDNPHD